MIGKADSSQVTGTASSGDATFKIDDVAEEAAVRFIIRRKLDAACYTEHAGLRTFGKPEVALVIDPIDGSRGAKSGFECCVVSVAVAAYRDDVRIADVLAACVHEIKEDRVFVAQRGEGVKVTLNGKRVHCAKSDATNINRAAWTAEFVGRPPELTARVLRDAIGASGIQGGFFVLNSTAYSLTRLVNGQLSAVVDVGGRILSDVPRAVELFRRAGRGQVVGLFPHDFAAAALIAQEAGCVVTDAHGKSLDDVYLLDSSESNVQSLVAACNGELHSEFIRLVSDGFAKTGPT
ncbi:MAG: hypothetical protein A2Z18_00340 [Armatimonadetes bacterium RBG_16_58_9]|nr:MAG: hypothetical protein A2Z18_00340 [Armatimonadetes bacterium RBG_16_58_9]